ncbi:MAG TPA: hypothetical protein VK586_27025 [Streptosporangiaceae bacterium]|nr:hypothetical protein [Streptosporangiaceae bacterium]
MPSASMATTPSAHPSGSPVGILRAEGLAVQVERERVARDRRVHPVVGPPR